jgi:hypothetical protein
MLCVSSDDAVLMSIETSELEPSGEPCECRIGGRRVSISCANGVPGLEKRRRSDD